MKTKIIAFLLMIFIWSMVSVVYGYTVKKGDTLSSIAFLHKTTWKSIHQMNNWIKDHNVIQIGWKLKVSEKIYKPVTSQDLAKWMFVIRHYTFIDKETLIKSFYYNRKLIKELEFTPSNILEIQNIIKNQLSIIERLELHYLAEVVIKTKDEHNELPLRITALLHQECTFRNVNNPKSGAIGYPQFLPSTAKWLGIDTKRLTFDMQYAIDMMVQYFTYLRYTNGNSWDRAVLRYGEDHPDYLKEYNNKLLKLKKYLNGV